MTKKTVLFFLCFTLFLMPGCKKKLPTQPDIPTTMAPTINYFLVLELSLKLGDSTTLYWDTFLATTVSINPGIGNVSSKGEMQISPEQTTTYTLTATNSAGSKTSTCTVTVESQAEVVMVGDWIHCEGWSIYPKFSAWGTVKNVGNKTAYNVRIHLYFYNKDAWGGGLYKEIEWTVSYFFVSGSEFDWRQDWHDQEAWDMCKYVNTQNVVYEITWE